MAHDRNPSYLGGRDQEDRGSKPVWGNSSRDPISKIPIIKKGWWSGSRCSPWVQALVPQKKKKKKSLQILNFSPFILGNTREDLSGCLALKTLGYYIKKAHLIHLLIILQFTLSMFLMWASPTRYHSLPALSQTQLRELLTGYGSHSGKRYSCDWNFNLLSPSLLFI
jgi:hypothetical protein